MEILETAAREAVGELKRAQESAWKAIENHVISKTWKAYDVLEEVQDHIAEPTPELKRAQESAWKAIENRVISKTWKSYDVLEEVQDDTAEPTPEDFAAMLKAILERTQPKETVQELSDDEDD